VDEGEVGVLFSPQSYYLHWSQEENANRIMNAMQGYLRALVRNSIPYQVVEEEHLEVLKKIKVLFLPRTVATTEKLEKALTDFVEQGGTLVCESECGAFDPVGIYRYPEERFPARLTGVKEVGRRNINREQVNVNFNGKMFDVAVTQWLTPWERMAGKIYCDEQDGALISEVACGKGKVILIGSYLGEPYFETWQPGFENFVQEICFDSGCAPMVKARDAAVSKDSFFYIKTGQSQGKKMVFVFFPKDQDEVCLDFSGDYAAIKTMTELITGKQVMIKNNGCLLTAPLNRVLVLVED
jgi:beta-galactosidase